MLLDLKQKHKVSKKKTYTILFEHESRREGNGEKLTVNAVKPENDKLTSNKKNNTCTLICIKFLYLNFFSLFFIFS